MARPRRAVIRAEVARNQPKLSAKPNPPGRGWKNPAGGPNRGVGNRTPAKPSNAQRGIGRGAAGAGAPAPVTGLPQPSTGLPWDSQSTLESAGGYRSAQDKLAGLRGNWDAEQRNIGLGQGYENNPYSQASLLQRQREIGLRGTLNRAGNQLYSGSTVNHLGGVEHGYNEGYAHLEEGYEAKRAQVEREELATQHEVQQIQEEAQLAAIERAREEAPEPAPVAEAAAPSGGGGGSKKKKPPPKPTHNDNLGGKKKR